MRALRALLVLTAAVLRAVAAAEASSHDSTHGTHDSAQDSGYDSSHDSSQNTSHDSSPESSHDSSHASSQDSSHDSSHASSHASSHDSSYGGDHGPINLFHLGEDFEYLQFVYILVVVCCFAVTLEYGLAKYEKWLDYRADNFQQTLYQVIVKELMMLGVISFILFLLDGFGVLDHDNYFITFEFTHYLIFFMALFKGPR